MLDPTDHTSNPVAWQDIAAGLRVVVTPKGPVVELADGKDSTGALRWVATVPVRDRLGVGEVALEGWKTIADALGVTVQTALLWARLTEYRLPVRHGIRGPYIFRSLLRAWVTDRSYAATVPSKASGRKPRGVKRKPSSKRGRTQPETAR